MSFLEGYARKLGVLEYLGTWNAATNTPTLTSGVGQKNGYYIVSTKGTTNLDGITDWDQEDWAIFNGSVWEQIDNQRPGTGIPIFGTGADGTVSLSSGTTTLTRDMFYENLTLSGTAKIKTNGFRLFVKNTLTLTNASAGAINFDGNSGSTGSGATGGAAGAGVSAGTVGGSQAGTAGGNKELQASAVASLTCANGGAAGGSGAGGNSEEGSGGVARASTAMPSATATFHFVTEHLLRGATLVEGGGGAPGGGGGGFGGGGGGGGAGGGVVAIFAKKINRGTSTATGAISANGGNGANGTYVSTAGAAGAGGGGGGGGGFVYLVCGELAGSQKTGCISASGGSGGNGADRGSMGAVAGDGGDGGSGGRIVVINLGTGSSSESLGSAGSAATPRVDSETGGIGGAGAITRVSL